MKEKLDLVIKNAYTPHSNFGVACIIKMKDDQEFVGVNVENSSFKSGLCAEQVAIASAVAEGYSKDDFKELHVMGSGNDYAYPCFLCRQLLVEFFKPDDKIVCYKQEGEAKIFDVAQLCPHAFSYEEVKND